MNNRTSQYATFDSYNGQPEPKEQPVQTAHVPVEFKDLQHKKQILSEKDTVIVLLYATWCGPCQYFKPKFADYCKSNTNGMYLFAQEDLDLGLTPGEMIRGVPSIVIYRHARIQHIITGGKLDELQDYLSKPRTNDLK